MEVSFSSLALVNNPFEWAYDLEDLGFTGWEVVSEGKQQLNDSTLSEIKNIIETTDLVLTLHLPFLRPESWEPEPSYLERKRQADDKMY